MASRVLIVEDDRDIADIVALNLADIGLEADRASDGATGVQKAARNAYALIVLDVMLPRLDGLSACARMRARDRVTPILMLTARSEEGDRVAGLDIGADDYLAKPFSVRELVARAKALLRRSAAGAGGGQVPAAAVARAGDIAVDFEKRRATRAGSEIDLTVKEFDLLALFLRSPGRTFSRRQIISLVWGGDFDGDEHTVSSHVNRLRGKVEADPGNPRLIRTAWGVGYRLADPGDGEHP